MQCNKCREIIKYKGKVIVIIAVVVALIGLIGGLITYSQVATFTIPKAKVDVWEYIEAHEEAMLVMKANTVTLALEEAFLNGCLATGLEEVNDLLGDDFTIQGVAVDVDEQRIVMNSQYASFNLPIGIKYKVDTDACTIGIEKLYLGKGKLPLPKGIIKGILGLETLEWSWREILPVFVEVETFEGKRDVLNVDITFAYKPLKKTLEDIRLKCDKEIVAMYAQSNVKVERLMGKMLTEGTDITTQDLEEVFQVSYKPDILNAVLVCLKEEEFRRIESKYRPYIEQLPRGLDIRRIREQKKKQCLYEKASEVFSMVKAYTYGYEIISNGGLCYNNDMREWITVETLIEEGYLDASFDSFSYILWDSEGECSLVYTQNGKHLAIDPLGYTRPVSNEEFNRLGDVKF